MQFSEERFLASINHIGDVLERAADALGDIAKEKQAQSAVERLLALDVLPPGLDWKQVGVTERWTAEQTAVLASALRLATGNGTGAFPLPGTHDHAILEGVLAQLEEAR